MSRKEATTSQTYARISCDELIRDTRSTLRIELDKDAVTSTVFLLLTACVWTMSLMLHALHTIYPLSDEMLLPLHKLELFLLYADVITTGVILLNAIVRYLLAALRGTS